MTDENRSSNACPRNKPYPCKPHPSQPVMCHFCGGPMQGTHGDSCECYSCWHKRKSAKRVCLECNGDGVVGRTLERCEACAGSGLSLAGPVRIHQCESIGCALLKGHSGCHADSNALTHEQILAMDQRAQAVLLGATYFVDPRTSEAECKCVCSGCLRQKMPHPKCEHGCTLLSRETIYAGDPPRTNEANPERIHKNADNERLISAHRLGPRSQDTQCADLPRLRWVFDRAKTLCDAMLKTDFDTRAVAYNQEWAGLHNAFTLPVPAAYATPRPDNPRIVSDEVEKRIADHVRIQTRERCAQELYDQARRERDAGRDTRAMHTEACARRLQGVDDDGNVIAPPETRALALDYPPLEDQEAVKSLLDYAAFRAKRWAIEKCCEVAGSMTAHTAGEVALRADVVAHLRGLLNNIEDPRSDSAPTSEKKP